MKWFVYLLVSVLFIGCKKTEPIEPIEHFSQVLSQNCSRYDSAINDIQKSKIFNETENYLQHVTLQNVVGILSSLYTNQGGSYVDVTIVTPFGEFYNPDIQSDTQLYQTLSTMIKTQCVKFSGSNLKPHSVFERSKVCAKDYRIQITTITGCSENEAISFKCDDVIGRVCKQLKPSTCQILKREMLNLSNEQYMSGCSKMLKNDGNGDILLARLKHIEN